MKTKKKKSRLSPAMILGIAVFVVAGFFILRRSLPRPLDVFQVASNSTFGQAMEFDGKTYIAAGDSTSINPTLRYGFVAEAWVKPAEATFSAMRIIDKTTATDKTYGLWMEGGYNSGEGTYRVNYNFDVADSSCKFAFTSFNQQVYRDPAAVTAWHHVAGVLHPDGRIEVFVDGKRSLATSNTVKSTCELSNVPVRMGMQSATIPEITAQPFRGLIDEVFLIDGEPYTSEFPVPNAPKNPISGMVMVYHLDGNTYDAIGGKHNGQVIGTTSYVPSTIPYLASPKPSPSALPSASPGCYWKEIQCVTTPCNPIMVCPGSPSPAYSIRPTPIPYSPKPSPSLSSCRARILSLTMFNRCGLQGYSAYGYQCDGGTLVKASGICMDAGTIYSKVKAECGLQCAVNASSVPVASAVPYPSNILY